MADRVDEAEEIVVTDEMIDEGLRAVGIYGRIDAPDLADKRAAVAEMYRAMRRAEVFR